ncbi:hypothetical protein NKJ44_00235 [Mesorhizobium sp. M0130]
MKQNPACVCQRRRTHSSIEQLRADVVLEIPKRLADGGLRDIQLRRRALDTAGTNHGFKGCQKPEGREMSTQYHNPLLMSD